MHKDFFGHHYYLLDFGITFITWAGAMVKIPSVVDGAVDCVGRLKTSSRKKSLFSIS